MAMARWAPARCQGWAQLTMLGLLLLHAASAYAPDMTPAEKALMEWAKSEGAELKVTISRNEHGVRGLFAAQDVAKGEILLNIPEHIILSVKNIGAAEAAPVLLKELSLPCSRLRPYLEVLPTPDGVLSGYNWPQEYIKYLADDGLIDQVESSFQKHVEDVMAGLHNEGMEMTIPEAIGRVNITMDYYKYVTSLLTTRTFSIRKAALSMVPIADLANHDSHEINHLDNSEGPGFRIIAGKDLKEGEEVTITYGPMRGDELALYYGFLEDHDNRLLVIDHPKYVPYESDSESLGEDVFDGTPEEVLHEIARLQGTLNQFEAALKELGPVPEHNKYAAFLTKGLHEKRRYSLKAEIERLTEILEKAEL